MNQIKVKKKQLLSISFIIAIGLIVAFRGNTPDTGIYSYIFNNIRDYSLNNPSKFYIETGVEWGLGFLAFITSLIFNNTTFFFFVISFLTTFVIYRTSNLIKVNFYYVLIAYIPTFFMVQQLMQIRQGLSTSLIFLALFYFDNKKIRSFFLIAIATLFHSSAFIILPLILMISKPFKYFFDYFKNNTFKTSILIILITSIMGSILLGIIESFSPRATAYMQADNSFSEPRGIFDPANIREYLMFIFFLYHRKIFFNNRTYFILLLSYTLDISIRLAFRDYAILSGRLGAVFAFSEIFLLPLILSKYSRLSAYIIGVLYFSINMAIALYIRVPTMISDYFSTRLY